MTILRSSNPRRFFLDIALFGLALAVFFTGESCTRTRDVDTHQVLAIAIACGVLLHVVWQARWIAGTSRRFFGTLAGRVRLNYVIDALILALAIATIVTGALISPWLTDAPDGELVHLHHMLPKLFVLGVLVHAALHARWLFRNARRLTASGEGAPTAQEHPAQEQTRCSRRS